MNKSQEHKHYTNIKISKPKNSEIDIEGEITVDAIMHHYDAIIKETRKTFEAPGFRKGNVPENIFLKSVNELAVWQEASEIALENAYPEIVHNEKIDVFGRPRITITKLAPKNPLGFKIHVAIIPEVKLPDYKKIGAKIAGAKKEIIISDEEISAVIKNIQRAQGNNKTENADMPDLTDDMVKTWGDFKDVQDFKSKLSLSIKEEKTIEESRKNREEIIEKIMTESKIDLPKIVVEDEANDIRERLLEELKKSSLSFEDYLKKSNKTAEKYNEEEKSFIEKDLKNRLILNKIAEIEKIEIDEKDIEENVSRMLKRHKDADPLRMHHYVKNMLINEKVFNLLEGK